MVHWTRPFCLALCSGSLFACVDDDEGRPATATDASIDAPRQDAVADTGVRAEAGAEGGSEQDSGASDASDGPNPDGGAVGPAIWLAYIADRTPDVDELWVVRVNNGVVGAPVRVNTPLEPNQNVTWMRWTDDGKQLAYGIGTQELFVVDMTGSAPRAPKRLADVDPLTIAWSPNGKYLAYIAQSPFEVRVVDLSQPTLTVRSPALCQADGGCLYPFAVHWSGDSEWLFGSSNYAISGVHVRDGILDPLTELFIAEYTSDISGFFVAPYGALAAVVTHRGLSGNRNNIRTFTPQGVNGAGTSEYPNTYFERWLRNGAFVYWGAPFGVLEGDTYLTACEHLRIFDLAGTRVSWKPAPDVATLAIVVDDASPSLAALYLRKRLIQTLPGDPCWEPPTVAVSDFSTVYEWAPDSRNLLYAKSSLYVLDTAGSPLPAPRELAGSIPAGATATSIAWGRSSNRIFYTTSNSLDLNYIDYRDPTPQPSAILTPGFAHAAGDAVAWQLSPTDSYAAAKGDFAEDGVFELYVTSVAGNRPEVPQRVNAAFSATQDVTAFAWQPVILTAP